MNPKSIVWCLWIISINSLCCCGRSEHQNFMSVPKIHSKSLSEPRARSVIYQKYISPQEISDFNTFSNEKINKYEKQLLINSTKQDTYPINKHLRSFRRFRREVLNNNLSDELTMIFNRNKQFNASRKSRALRNMALVETQSNNLYREMNSSLNHYNGDDMARNSLYNYSDHEDTEVNQEKNRLQNPAVSNRHIWVKDQAPTLTSLNESEATNDNETFNALLEQFKRMYPISLWKENGWFKEDYLYIINAHWLQFPPPSKASHYTLAVVYIFVLTAGMSGNALVIFMFFK